MPKARSYEDVVCPFSIQSGKPHFCYGLGCMLGSLDKDQDFVCAYHTYLISFWMAFNISRSEFYKANMRVEEEGKNVTDQDNSPYV